MNNTSTKPKSPLNATQTHLPIAEIHDNTVILKNGEIRAILAVSSINFHLKSEQEQNGIISAYQNFLNSLDFTTQILIKSQKLDIDLYIEALKKRVENNNNPLLKQQTLEYCEYIGKLVEYADIMEKRFYIVIPHEPYRSAKKNFLEKFMDRISPEDSVAKIKARRLEFETLSKTLKERVETAKQGLENCNLRVKRLGTKELIELFYGIYNPLTSREEKIRNIDQIGVWTGE